MKGVLPACMMDDGPWISQSEQSSSSSVQVSLKVRAKPPNPTAPAGTAASTGASPPAAAGALHTPTHTAGARPGHNRGAKATREFGGGRSKRSEPFHKRSTDTSSYAGREREAKAHTAESHSLLYYFYFSPFNKSTHLPPPPPPRRATTRCMAADHSSLCLERPSLRRRALSPSSLRSAYVASSARCVTTTDVCLMMGGECSGVWVVMADLLTDSHTLQRTCSPDSKAPMAATTAAAKGTDCLIEIKDVL